MRILGKIAAAGVLAVMSKVAVAAPVDYTFQVEFNFGPLQGSSALVEVTLDSENSVKIGDLETFVQSDSSLLAFDFTFGGRSFAITDANGPRIELYDGMLDGVQYGQDGEADAFLSLVPFLDNYVEYYVPADDVFSTGFIQPTTFGVAAVPIPAAAWLFGSALIGLGVIKRKKA